MKNTNLNISFICPACKIKQTEFLQAQTATMIWKFTSSNDYPECIDTVDGEIEGYMCANCNENIPESFISKLPN